MSKKIRKYHGENDSPFYKLSSKAKLTDLLFVSAKKLQFLSTANDLYFEFPKQKSSGGFRLISAPRDDLKSVQSRIADLLHRLVPPDYLFAPVARRSYVDNAARHLGATSIRLLDIEDFFPSCKANKVIWFFRKRMNCSPDVAAIIRGIVTKDGCLPQGSPCSPILAYLSYLEMWEEIARQVRENRCRHSLYADDITVSGESGAIVPEKLIWEIKKTLFRHGHKYKITKERSKHKKPAEITGVIVLGNRLYAPNRQLQKLYMVRRDLLVSRSKTDRKKLEVQLIGREAQLKQINAPRREALQR
jgi:Reverse transcriptase (RNA-dependent DNA polymerase)